jgi:NIPSNAP
MNRRTLMTLPVGSVLLQAQSAAPQRAYFELRRYKMRSGRQVERTTAYLQKGWLPAASRASIQTVGLFSAVVAPDSPFILTLSSYPSLAALETAREHMAADAEFQAARDEFDSMTEISYIRMESSILRAFPSMPAIEVPPQTSGRAARIFELRTYESPNEKANDRKVKMFGDGEIAIFRKSGMLPVCFGQTIFGHNLPNLTYMLAYDDLAARDKTWRAFSADPDWQKLRATPGLSDAEIVNNISNEILRPLPFSPIR